MIDDNVLVGVVAAAAARDVGTVVTLRGRTMYESRPMHWLTYRYFCFCC